MRKFVFILCFLMTNAILFSQSITLEDIVRGKYKAKGVDIPVSSSDGNFYYEANDNHSKIVKFSYKSGLAVDTILDFSVINTSYPIKYFEGFMVDPSEKKILIFNNGESIYRHSFVADYYMYDIDSQKLQKLAKSQSKQTVPLFSNDGSMLAYVLNNNIYIYQTDTGRADQITDDGAIGTIINGATDWVYEEEFATTSIMSFSPDNKYLAYIRFDESQVKEFSFQEYRNQLYPTNNSFKYPKAGEKNSTVACNVYDIKNKVTQNITLDSNVVEYIPRIEFTSDSQLALMALNRDQNKFSLYMVDVEKANKANLIFEDNNDRYINYDFFSSIHFLSDSFTYISEQDGYSHIYLYSMDGRLLKQLTSGNYDVTALLSVNPATHTIYFQAADESPMERSINSVNYKTLETKRLSKNRGVNSASFSNNGQYFINNWSDINTPNVISVVDAKGNQIRILEENKVLKHEIKSKKNPQKEFFTLKGADDTPLNAWMLKPVDFDKNRKYPLLMVQYSGPDSQQVLNQFGIDWIHFLATKGYIIVCVDGRGTGARGQDFRKCTYLNLGIKESDDQIAAAKNLSYLPYIDSQNISIWGWSYGGYNVLMSLSRSKGIFKKGIAIAPVTDWRFYDSVYTERYMKTPQENQVGYDNGSPVKLADHLSGRLLLIHGSADDNVHYQNSMTYISALISAEKQFDLFVFPDLNHSLQGVKNRQYLYSKIINFLEE